MSTSSFVPHLNYGSAELTTGTVSCRQLTLRRVSAYSILIRYLDTTDQVTERNAVNYNIMVERPQPPGMRVNGGGGEVTLCYE